MKCKQRNRCNSNMMRVTSTLALATGLLFPAPIAIQANGMQNANISVQQDNVTTGRIIDENGEPLIGVTVRVLKGNSGTVTDIDGNYSLRVAKGTQLKITYTGYKDQIIRAGGTAQMQPDELNLNEVVVVGYGVQRKSDVTGALIRVGEKEMNERPVGNALEAMQGKAAGVDITSNERPGEIGNITVRGVRSINAQNSPLYVVDGIPLMSESGIETINPRDIQSIDILKDASATAIYGSRGANGVVLVTTKQGESGKAKVSYNGTMTFETLEDYSRQMNSAEYIEWRRWSYYYMNPDRYPRADQPTIENDREIFKAEADPTAWNNIMKGWEGGTWDGSKVPTFDWQDMVTQTGITHEHTLSVSGGNDKIKSYLSFGILDNKGTIRGQSYRRYSSKISVDAKPAKWFNLGANINGSYGLQQYGSTASSQGSLLKGLPSNLYYAATSEFPYAQPYDEDGNRITNPGGDDMVRNIADEWKHSTNERRMFRVIASLYAQVDLGEIWEPLNGLRYRLNFGPDFRYRRTGTFRDKESTSSQGQNHASNANNSNVSWTMDNLIYYNRDFGQHSLGLTLLESATKYRKEGSSLAANGIPYEPSMWNALDKSQISQLSDWGTDLVERQLLSYMIRANYSFADKYLLTLSGRWDGASQLADGHKWAFFPSAALGWNMQQEDFLKDVSWICQLKLRLGVGVTGNSAIDPYQTKGGVASLFYPFGSSLQPGYAPSEPIVADGNLPMANTALGWEKTTQWNLGIDFSFLKGRIGGVIDIYTSKTKDLLMQMSIPSINGYKNTWANIGETSNKGIDITLNTVNITNKDFSWTTSLNVSYQKDKIDKLANGKEDDINNNLFIGEAINSLYDYQFGGIWQPEDAELMAKFNENGNKFSAGMIRPVDQNGDNRIDPNNDRVVIGNTNPHWILGMTNTFTYKGFDLSFMLYGRFGYKVSTGGEWQGGRYMQRAINYYNENNHHSEYQKPIYNIGGGDSYYKIAGYKDGGFIKVRNISLGYTFPKELISHLGVSNLRVYVQAKNPFRIYSAVKFLELDATQAYTSNWNRGWTIGLNLDF